MGTLPAASPFYGEGYRKLWARLRFAGIRTSKRRVLRLTPRACTAGAAACRPAARLLAQGFMLPGSATEVVRAARQVDLSAADGS